MEATNLVPTLSMDFFRFPTRVSAQQPNEGITLFVLWQDHSSGMECWKIPSFLPMGTLNGSLSQVDNNGGSSQGRDGPEASQPLQKRRCIPLSTVGVNQVQNSQRDGAALKAMAQDNIV